MRFPSIFISATDLKFSASCLLFMCPNHSNLLLLMTNYQFHPCFLRDLPIFVMFWWSHTHCPLHYPRLCCCRSLFIFYSHWPCFAAVMRRRSNHCLAYQELQFRFTFLVTNHSSQISPFRPCVCHSAPPFLSIVDPRYLKECTVGMFTIL